jgi:hypothetical protein
MQHATATCNLRSARRFSSMSQNPNSSDPTLAGSPQRPCRAVNESRMPPPPLVRVGSKRRRTRPMLLPYATCHVACCATWHPACLHGMAVLGASRASAATCSSSSRPTPTRFTSHIGAAAPSILLCVCWGTEAGYCVGSPAASACAQRGFGDRRQCRAAAAAPCIGTDSDCPRSCGCSS